MVHLASQFDQDASGNYDHDQLAAAITKYDGSWTEWHKLLGAHPDCRATIWKDTGFLEATAGATRWIITAGNGEAKQLEMTV